MLAAAREDLQIELDHVPADDEVGVELADASRHRDEQASLVRVDTSVGVVDPALGHHVYLLDPRAVWERADEGGREDHARVEGGFEVERESGELRPRASGSELGIAEVQELLAQPRPAGDRDRGANAVVDQVAVLKANIALARACAFVLEAIAQGRHCAGNG